MGNLVEAQYNWETGDPAEGAFEILADVEWRGAAWEFDLTRIYKEKATGKLFYAEDSGCSCPTPFESTTTDNLQPITRLQDFHDHVASRVIAKSSDDDYQYPEPTPASAIDGAHAALQIIENHLKKATR